jgi:hypothetical protein
MTYGLHFVSSDSIEEIFAEAIMSEAPSDSRCTSYADYLTVNYITQESKCPLSIWAEPPSDEQQMELNRFIPILTHSFIFVILPCMPTRMLLCKSKLLIISRSGISLKLRCNRDPKRKALNISETYGQSFKVDKYLKSVGYKYQANTDI